MTRIFILLLVVIASACDRPRPAPMTDADNSTSFPTFRNDLAFLREHGAVQVLEAPNGARVALSAQYQGRVMTSAVSPDGRSAGYVNRSFIEAGETGTQFDNFGGEDRFWLGPEGGQFGIYFPSGVDFNLDTWQVPQEMQTGTWDVQAASDSSVTYARTMEVTNYSGTSYRIDVERVVRLLSAQDVETHFGAAVPEEWVAFESVNTVTNAGDATWMPESGQPSIWILCMYRPLGTSWVVVPFEGPPTEDALSSYFGAIPPERLQFRDGYAVFKADGAFRSKIGVAPDRATASLGSYSPDADLLTLVQFDLPAQERRYVNSQWELQDEPYAGDVVNSYNDGPPGAGGFYEMESSSPALGLAPGESYTHRHRTLHASGTGAELDALARAALGVPVDVMAAGI